MHGYYKVISNTTKFKYMSCNVEKALMQKIRINKTLLNFIENKIGIRLLCVEEPE